MKQQTTSRYDVILSVVGDRKINVIKAAKQLTGLGLKEAKDLVESVPVPIKAGISKEEAESIKKKLEEDGATIDIQESKFTEPPGQSAPVQPEKTEAPKDTGPNVQVEDAWDHSFEIAKGLWDLLSIGCGSDEGFTPEGLSVLEVAAQQLINEMNIVNSFFNPEEQE